MIKLDDNLLTELGLQSLPAEDKKALLRHIYETLEMRVGTTLARQMTDAQLDEFEGFINNNDEAGALRWLETNFPNYKDVVAQEFEVLKAEVRQSAPQIMASAGSAAAMPQQQPVSEMQQPQMAAPQPDYQQQYQQPYPQSAVASAPQQMQQAQPYEQQQAYNPMPAQPQMAQPMPTVSQPQMAAPQPDYQQQYQQPQPMQQFDPMTAQTPQQQPYATPQYPQPVTPSPYQQPTQQTQQQSQPPFDQNQFGQAA